MWRYICWKEILDWEGEPVAELEFSVPLPAEYERGAVRMGRYYARLAAVWYRRWTEAFYREACIACSDARENARPFWPWRARLQGKETYEDDRLCSMWMEASERRGREEGHVIRTAMTWSRKTGYPLPMADLFRHERGWRGQVLDRVREQLQPMREEGVILWKDAERLAAVRFSTSRFFLLPDGLGIYYPTGALGPNESGIIDFLLPLEGENQTLDGQKNPE